MPAVHRIKRDQWSFYYDPAAKPVLSVKSGDTVIVETEDAHCGTISDTSTVYPSLDEVFLARGGANPVTGPICVEGCRAGDCLEVTFNRIVPGPVRGHGYTVLTPGLGGLVSNYSLQPALTPTTVICPIEGDEVLFPARGKQIRLPVRPFIGSVGVAPTQEKRLSYFQGPDFVGNVDMPEMGPPNRLVVRANVDGALLSLGDAHATQGDGEISGAAIECQADAEITVRIIPAAAAEYVALPQINSDQWIGSLAGMSGVHTGDVARAAVIDLVQRLVRFYGFTLAEAYLLMGQAVQLRIGQIVDPLYSVLARIDRRYLD